MTLQDYIKHVRRVLDEYDTDISFWSDEELTVWLNEALMETSKISQHLTQKAYITPTPEDEYQLPGDYIDWYKLKINDEFLDEIGIEEVGAKRGFYIWGNTISLSKSESDDKITLFYYRTAQKMVNKQDEPELPLQYEDILIPFCLYRAFTKDRKTDEAALHQQEFQQRVQVMRRRYNREPNRASWKVLRS